VHTLPGFADEGFGLLADAFVDNFRRANDLTAALRRCLDRWPSDRTCTMGA
jgi:hypothetical protein